MLTGACISRAGGFPARARYATAACVIAAELPDIDYIYRLGGPLTYFQHHRGWTHTLWALPLEALLVVGIFWAKHQTRRRRRRSSGDQPAQARWFLLFLMALLALCSHILLDWSNNYGVRPFAPFVRQWFAGELVYIVEPVFLLLLTLALVGPFVFSLMHRETGIRRPRYQGRILSAAALGIIAFLWCQRYFARGDAETVVRAHEFAGGELLHLSLSPYPISPHKWHVVAETPVNFQTGFIDTGKGVFETDPQQIYPKAAGSPAVLAARRSWLGQVYLDWSPDAVVTDAGTPGQLYPDMAVPSTQAADRVIRFTDLRFGYDVLGLRSSASASRGLGAEVWINPDRQPDRIFFGGQEQKFSR